MNNKSDIQLELYRRFNDEPFNTELLDWWESVDSDSQNILGELYKREKEQVYKPIERDESPQRGIVSDVLDVTPLPNKTFTQVEKQFNPTGDGSFSEVGAVQVMPDGTLRVVDDLKKFNLLKMEDEFPQYLDINDVSDYTEDLKKKENLESQGYRLFDVTNNKVIDPPKPKVALPTLSRNSYVSQYQGIVEKWKGAATNSQVAWNIMEAEMGNDVIENLYKVAELQAKTKGIKESEAQARLRKASEIGWGPLLKELKSDPIELGIGFAIESFRQFMPTYVSTAIATVPTGAGIGGAVAGPPGAITGAGYGLTSAAGIASFGLEYSGKILEILSELGVDITNPEQLALAWYDDEIMSKARIKAAKKAGTIAMFDMFSAGMGGKTFKAASNLPGGKVTGMVGEAVAQASAGGGGEAASQIVIGEDVQRLDVVAEAFGQISQSAPSIAYNIASAQNQIIKENKFNKTKLGQEVIRAEEEGKFSKRTTNMVRKLAMQNPEVFDQVSVLNFVDEVREITADQLRSQGKDPEAFFEGEGLNANTDEAFVYGSTMMDNGKVLINLYKGADPTTVVEEFYGNHYRNLSEKSKDIWQKYYDKAVEDGEKRTSQEFFEQEGVNYYFGQALDSDSTILNMYRKVKNYVDDAFGRSTISPEIRKLYEDAGFGKVEQVNVTEDAEQDIESFQLKDKSKLLEYEDEVIMDKYPDNAGVVFIGGDAVSVDMDGKEHPTGYRYPEKYMKQGSGWQLSKGGATRMKNLADQGFKTVAVVVYPKLQAAMKHNPVYQEALKREMIKKHKIRQTNKFIKEGQAIYDAKERRLQKKTSVMQEAAKLAKVSLIQVARDIGESEFDKTGGKIVGVGKFKDIRTGDDRIVKHEVYPAEVLFENYQRLPKPIDFNEFRDKLSIEENKKKGAWLMMQTLNFWLQKDNSKLIPKLVEAGEGDVSLLQKDIEEGRESFQLGEKDIYGKPSVKKTPKRTVLPWSKAIIPISTRLKRIHPKLKKAIRDFEFGYLTQTNKDRQRVQPFLDKMNELPEQVRDDLDLALKNQDMPGYENDAFAIAEKHGFVDEYQETMDFIEEMYERASEAGIEMGYIQNYFPRLPSDYTGLVNYLGLEEKGKIDKEFENEAKRLNKTALELTDDEKAKVIDNMIRRPKGDGKLSSTKQRKLVDAIDPDINQFYEDSESRLLGYIDGMNEQMAINKFFGKGDRTESIGNYVAKMVTNGEIDRDQQAEVIEILNSRFNRSATPQWVSNIKNMTYVTTMGSITSAVTQIGDLTWSIYKAGGYQTAKELVKAVTGKVDITKEDIGIEKVAAEYQDTLKSSQYVDSVFKYSGLTKMDRLGKETLINAAINKYRNRANKKDTSKLESELQDIFGDETSQVIEDLKSGEVTENVKMLAFNTLLDFQPATLSEMPEGYLKSGAGKLAYQLKTFTIKQLDVFRNESIDKMYSGDKKAQVEGIKNLIHLSAALMLSNFTADWIKDWLMGRPRHWDDIGIENLYRVFGISRYVTWQAKVMGIDKAIYSVVGPPALGQVAQGGMDAAKLAEGVFNSEKPFYEQLHKVKFINWIPIIGKPIYWNLGGGSRKSVEQELDRYNAIKKGTRWRDSLFGKRKLTPTEKQAYREAITYAFDKGWISSRTKTNHFRGW